MSDYVPDHLIADVLLRLPFDSLIQSRAVSKSWRDLIDSPEFIKMHFDKHRLESDDTAAKIVTLNQNKFYTLDFDRIGSATPTATAKQLNYTLDYSESEVHLVGSCNGLLCLRYPTEDKIVVWNPWIQKSWELPSLPVDYSEFGGGTGSLLGFGYDRVNDDYKVLNKMTFPDLSNEEDWHHEIYVYSFKFNAWRKMEKFPFDLFEYQYHIPCCTFVNGALHWMMMDKEWNGASYIVAFDLCSEEFRKMSCPRQPERAANWIFLRALNDCLCFISYYYGENGRQVADIWWMEDYGVEESWTKLTSVEMLYDTSWTIWYLTPLAYSKNNRQLLFQIDGENVVVYDLQAHSITDVVMNGAQVRCLDSHIHVGSLIRPC